MKSLTQLTDFVDRLQAAESFDEASRVLTGWAQEITGSRTAFLRMLQSGDGVGWLPICQQTGLAEDFLRDEAIIREDECVCGLVTQRRTDEADCFTPGGSFVWERLQFLQEDFGGELVDGLRGRCIEEGYDSLAVFPVLSGGEPAGTLHLAEFDQEHWGDSVEVVEAACAVAGRILQRHRRHEQEQTAFAVIQRALLPPTPPQIPGLEVGLSFSSATELAQIGGDFYEIIDLGGRGTLLLVGDYSGKGIEAAGFAAQARYTLATLAGLDPAPGRLLEAANQAMAGTLSEGGFVSCAACLLYPGDGSLRVALAGHPAPLRLGPAGVEELDAPAHLPLGVEPHTSYVEFATRLGPDDVLLLYTDGVTEARRDGRLFGVEGIVHACRALGVECLQSLASGVCREASAFHGAGSSGDDRLVLTACRRRAEARKTGSAA